MTTIERMTAAEKSIECGRAMVCIMQTAPSDLQGMIKRAAIFHFRAAVAIEGGRYAEALGHTREAQRLQDSIFST